jgi:hypothetical protein
MHRSHAGTRSRFGALPGFLLAAACASGLLLPEPDGEIIVDFEGVYSSWPDDDWQLQGARVEGPGIELSVGHAGGCKDHDFWLVAVDGFAQLPSAGPVPRVAVPVLLAHDAHGDPCEAYLTPELQFDLQPLVSAYRNEFATAPADIFLRIPTGQNGADTVSVLLQVPAE